MALLREHISVLRTVLTRFTLSEPWMRHRPQDPAGAPGWPDDEPGLWLGHQQARNVSSDLHEIELLARFVIRDCDSKFTRSL